MRNFRNSLNVKKLSLRTLDMPCFKAHFIALNHQIFIANGPWNKCAQSAVGGVKIARNALLINILYFVNQNKIITFDENKTIRGYDFWSNGSQTTINSSYSGGSAVVGAFA